MKTCHENNHGMGTRAPPPTKEKIFKTKIAVYKHLHLRRHQCLYLWGGLRGSLFGYYSGVCEVV